MLSLLGSLLGFGTSFLPSVLDYFKEKRDQAHELKMMDKQLEQQIQIGAQKLQMVNVDADIRESEALLKSQSRLVSKASQWVVNLSASVRPVMTYLLFLEFMVLTGLVSFDLMTQEDYMMIWNNEMQAIWAAVVSFWFGSRSFNRSKNT